jgi:hypothetical protein
VTGRLASTIAVVCAAVAAAPPLARAQEFDAPATSGGWVAPVENLDAARERLGLSKRVVLDSTSVITAAPTSAIAPLRLSSEAKTAIIIGAVVVGVLLIVGVVVLAKPGKHIP